MARVSKAPLHLFKPLSALLSVTHPQTGGASSSASTWPRHTTGRLLCSSRSCAASACSMPIPPPRSPPAPPTARSCGATSKSGQVTLLSLATCQVIMCLLFRVPAVVFLTTACARYRRRCRGAPVLVVLQEPAEGVGAGEAMADRPLAAGRPGTPPEIQLKSELPCSTLCFTGLELGRVSFVTNHRRAPPRRARRASGSATSRRSGRWT